MDKKLFDDLKKNVEPIKQLAMHNDADGISSAVLMSFIFDIKQVWCPDDFGVWSTKPTRDAAGEVLMPPDAAVDMIPQDPNWIGKIVVDHHPGHLPELGRKYHLIHGDIPTSGLVWRVFKEQLPKEQWWKAAVGLVGDGQPELIPGELFLTEPSLLDKYITGYKKFGYYKLEIRKMPMYLKLSAPLNAAAKIPGKWQLAYTALRNAQKPMDILEDPSLDAAKQFVKQESDRVLKGSHAIEMSNGIRLWSIKTPLTLERTLAFESEQMDMTTTIVLNEQTGRGSVRGALSDIVCGHLRKHGFKASGHPGFAGMRLDGKTYADLCKALRELRIA
jgi:hypothetical protein